MPQYSSPLKLTVTLGTPTEAAATKLLQFRTSKGRQNANKAATAGSADDSSLQVPEVVDDSHFKPGAIEEAGASSLSNVGGGQQQVSPSTTTR